MRFKKTILLLFVVLSIFLIYLFTLDKKTYYLALGDSLAAGQNPYGVIGYGYSDYVKDYLKEKNILEFYTKDFAKSGYRSVDLLRDIEDNKEIIVNEKKITIKNALIKADIVTISIGANDLFYKIGIKDFTNVDFEVDGYYKYIDEVMKDVDELLFWIRKYCKEKIILVGYYDPLNLNKINPEFDLLFNYANEKMNILADNHNMEYADIYELFKNNSKFLPNPFDIHPNNDGYKAISKVVIDIIRKK